MFIPDTPAQTFCLSTQVGCAMGCAFCLTGKMGLVRNLTAAEITAQVRVLAGLAGDVFLTGTTSGGSEWWFRVAFGPSKGFSYSNLFQIDLYSGGLLPPKNEAVGPQGWDQTVSVTVGQKYYLWAKLYAHVGGAGFYDWPIGTYTNYVDFYGTGTTGLGYASGYEGLNIVSSAGAGIAPVAQPETYAILVAGLALVGGAARIRNMRSDAIGAS